MEPRVREIFKLVIQELDKADLLNGNRVPAGLVLTGGGALTAGVVEVAKKVSNLPVRLAIPEELEGLTEDIKRPNFAVGVGLLEYALRQGKAVPVVENFDWQKLLPSAFGQKVSGVVQKFFKSLLP